MKLGPVQEQELVQVLVLEPVQVLVPVQELGYLEEELQRLLLSHLNKDMLFGHP